MTSEEMFQLLVSKFNSVENELKELRKGQVRLEAKLDAAIADFKDQFFYVDVNIKAILVTSKETRTDIAEFKAEVAQKFDRQAKSIKYFDKSLVHFHDRLGDVEEEVKEVKDKLEKAS
jgi:predicted transcriptional regulator